MVDPEKAALKAENKELKLWVRAMCGVNKPSWKEMESAMNETERLKRSE